jgi:hypothetical protein
MIRPLPDKGPNQHKRKTHTITNINNNKYYLAHKPSTHQSAHLKISFRQANSKQQKDVPFHRKALLSNQDYPAILLQAGP